MKKILLPTDFSDNAWNAIFTAVKLYANIPCYFYVLHAYEPNTLNLLDNKSQQRLGVIYDSLKKYSEQQLTKVLDYMNKNHKNSNHSFETISKSDTLVEAIKEEAYKKDIDLIVMGTQGATSAKEIFMGSQTVKVLKKLKTYPILAIPTDYNFQVLRSLIFPTDFTRKYEKSELLPLTHLAAQWKAEIKVVHVAVEFMLNDTQKANMKILEDRLRESHFSYHQLPFDNNIASSIEHYVIETRADLICMVRHYHGVWERFIKEAVIKKIAFHSKVPVLFLSEHP